MIKIKYWLDNGANIHSRRESSCTVEELGYADDEWLEMSAEDKDEAIREVVFEWVEWDYEEVQTND